MAEPISNKFYDLLRLHLETGTDYRYMRFTDEQKKRVAICIDTYKQLEINPYLNIREYLKNRHHRTMSEMYNDTKVIDFITSVCQTGGKSISRMRVRKNAELAMKMGYDQGNADVMLKAGKQLMEVDELNKPETGRDMEEDIAKLPPVFVSDARKLYPNKGHSTEEQMDRIRKKWGVKKDRIQEMVERKIGEFVAVPEARSARPEYTEGGFSNENGADSSQWDEEAGEEEENKDAYGELPDDDDDD